MCKEVEKMKELVEDGKQMMTFMENMIHSGLETHRKEWGDFIDELSKDGKKMMTKLDGYDLLTTWNSERQHASQC